MLSSLPRHRQIIDLFSGRDERRARIVRDLSSASLPPASLRSVTHRLVIGWLGSISSGEFCVSTAILGKNIASRRNSYTTLYSLAPGNPAQVTISAVAILLQSIRPATPPFSPAVGALPGDSVIDSLCFYGSCTAYTH